ncbi:MAG: fumarylacetoacetate hydrolase family protein [Candidatus Eremiobacteraeota bacterium]|nr:fumarylacetoacetate hydrolase family protein [Candidatus Eremiobacteraeota bacterium]MBV8654581.1 fumarylacetoacetate hydrolase family protein [Candidatus Eremiobacteraeota bacterium]
MRFVTYRTADGTARPGVLEGDAIRTISTPTMREYVALAPHERIAWHSADDSELVPLANVVLDAPIRPERNVFCVGRNYLEHAKEGARVSGRELKLPSVPTFFTKAPTAIAAPAATLRLSARISREWDFEAELAVVIGARCRDVAESDAHAVVFGYTALNDVTARDLQREHGQWFKGKSLDDACPIGPWIVTPEELGDPGALEIRCRINGVQKQHSNTSQMIFPIARLIAELSKGMTLLPGDVIATGTPEGVGFARTPPEFLSDGDAMEVDIERIGILRNAVSIG